MPTSARLVRTLTEAGLVHIGAEARTPLVAGGTENWIPGTVEHLADYMVGTGLVTARDIESVLAMTADRACHYVPSPWSQPGASAQDDHARCLARHGCRVSRSGAAAGTWRPVGPSSGPWRPNRD